MNLLLLKRTFHSTTIVNAGKIWRQKNNLPKLQTALNVFIDTPDYSFLDGRPTPLTEGQRKRQETQDRLAREIIDGIKYIKEAKSGMQNDIKKLIELKNKSGENILINKAINNTKIRRRRKENNKTEQQQQQ